MFQLPNEIIAQIYQFDSTYTDIFNITINFIKSEGKNLYFDFQRKLWDKNCKKLSIGYLKPNVKYSIGTIFTHDNNITHYDNIGTHQYIITKVGTKYIYATYLGARFVMEPYMKFITHPSEFQYKFNVNHIDNREYLKINKKNL
jgi:hypothetical protein